MTVLYTKVDELSAAILAEHTVR